MMSLNNKCASARGPGVQLPIGGVQRSYIWRGCLAIIYAENLTAASKGRSKEKISLIGGLDPFLKGETSLSLPERSEQS